MRFGRVAALASGACAAAAFACSSFGSDDAPAEVDASDAVPTPPPPPPAPTRAFCSDKDASFCWSFDETKDPLLGPKLTVDKNGTPLTPGLSDAALSPPHAMFTALPDATKNTCALILPSAPTHHLHCDFSIFVEALEGGSDVLHADPSGSGVSFALRLEPMGSASSVQAKVFIALSNVTVGNIPLDTWTPVSLDAAIDGDTLTVTGAIPGASQSNKQTAGEAGSPAPVDGGYPALGATQLQIGLTYSFSGGVAVRYDDIVCHWQ